METYDGIDYGMGRVNLDKDTGIRYGIIHTNKVAHWIWDEVENIYPDRADCEECHGDDEIICPSCDMAECLGQEYDKDGLQFSIDSDGDLWVFKSPVVSTGTFCSPCAPGAVSLGTSGNVRCYALPSDWFDDDAPCPYETEEV